MSPLHVKLLTGCIAFSAIVRATFCVCVCVSDIFFYLPHPKGTGIVETVLHRDCFTKPALKCASQCLFFLFVDSRV